MESQASELVRAKRTAHELSKREQECTRRWQTLLSENSSSYQKASE